ncbi:WAT1-related protein [Drosera capensis]
MQLKRNEDKDHVLCYLNACCLMGLHVYAEVTTREHIVAAASWLRYQSRSFNYNRAHFCYETVELLFRHNSSANSPGSAPAAVRSVRVGIILGQSRLVLAFFYDNFQSALLSYYFCVYTYRHACLKNSLMGLAKDQQEGCTIALTITAEYCDKQRNQFVFVAYSNALSSIMLLPCSLLVKNHRIREMLNLNLLTRFFFLGLTEIAIAQNLAFTGLRHSSPIVVCGMGLLLPTFQFALSLILSHWLQTSKEGQARYLEFKHSNQDLRCFGEVAGATIVALYEGLSVIHIQRFHSGIRQWKLERLVLNSTEAQWLYGSILLACTTLSLAVWSTIQVATMTRFPDMLLMVTSYTILGTLQTAFVDLIAERDLSAWKLDMNLELTIIVLTVSI